MIAAAFDPAALVYARREGALASEPALVPVAVQSAASGALLMLAYASREAVERTLATGEAWFYSRSRAALWKKGETSGQTLAVREVLADCDRDALLYRVRVADPAGPTCHLGTASCFAPNAARLELGWLAAVIAERRSASPESSYTARLFAAGVPRIAQKVGEEGVEVALAAALAAERAGAGDLSPEARRRVIDESADLLYHLLALLEATGIDAGEVARELEDRHVRAR